MKAWSSLLLAFFSVRSVYSMEQRGPTQCVIIQDKLQDVLPRVPDFLVNTPAACRINRKRQNALQCGHSDVYIKPECVCTVLNVLEEKYHKHTACPNGENSDSVLKLRCSDCKRYSLDNKGPCINGGNLTCPEDVLAPDITCTCPHGYSGMFCESKMFKVVRICDRIPPNRNLPNCDVTKMDCITYSENKKYAFKCNETKSDQILARGDLPLCNDTETIVRVLDTTTAPTEMAPTGIPLNQSPRSNPVISGADSCTACLSSLVMTITSLFLLVER